jgi:O-antigen/teichoic acid export membrane protein
MKQHIGNAGWGVLDYAAYPFAMLITAPTLLRHLGAEQYGVWVACTAAISTGGILASGFGDANIQQVALHRNDERSGEIVRVVRTMMGINAVLGLLLTMVTLGFVPVLARHLVAETSPLHTQALQALKLAGLLIFTRAIESVCISTQRAFERYGHAVAVSLTARVLTVFGAALLGKLGYTITSIMVLTFVASTLALALQLRDLSRLLYAATLRPCFDLHVFTALWSFGSFSWLQAAAAVMLSQTDRLVLGGVFGAAALTAYALCLQVAQPIYGLSAAGLHFLFPHLAARGAEQHGANRRTVAVAFALNTLFTIVLAGLVLLFGSLFMSRWVGPEIASATKHLLPWIVLGFALLSLGVPAYYALLAAGRVRIVAFANLLGGVVMILALTHAAALGLRGIAMARALCGLLALAIYLPLLRRPRASRKAGRDALLPKVMEERV